MALAQLVFLPVALAMRGRGAPPTRAARTAAVWTGVLFGADLAFFNSAIMRTTAANATLLGGNAPMFVALGTWALFGDRPRRRFWVGFALSFAGIVLIAGTDFLRHPVLGVGDALATAGAVCYAAYLIALRQSRLGMDALTLMTVSGLFATATLFVICLVLGAPLAGFSMHTWEALIGLALVSQVIGQMGVAYAMGRVSAPAASIILLAQAPVAAILAVPFLGERVTVVQLGGGALVLVGIYVVNATSLRSRVTE